MANNNSNNPSAALIIIGNEILSGRTLDKNTQHIAKTLGILGIDLLEVRVIPDVEHEIVDTVNALRRKYTYIFTTGGIGPTHDDITPESIAKAFGRKLVLDKDAHEALIKYYGGEQNLNEGRLKMCYLPENAGKIFNAVTAAPGFYVENVYVMAGVPKIMQAMLEAIIPTLERGVLVQSHTIRALSPESQLAAEMTKAQNDFPDVQIGSYPFLAGDEGYATAGVNIVFRGKDPARIEASMQQIEKELNAKSVSYERIL